MAGYFIKCLTERETERRLMQKLDAETVGKMLELSMKQLIRNVRVFSQHCERDAVILEKGRDMTQLADVPSIRDIYMCVDRIHSGNTSVMSSELFGTAIFAGSVWKRM